MNAVVVASPGNIRLVSRATPTPGTDQVLVDVAYAAICHTDHFIAHGGHPSARYPIVPGHEFSGVVSEVGSAVVDIAVGDRVAVQTQVGCGKCESCATDQVGLCASVQELGSQLDGGWQERIAVDAAAVVRLPDSVTLLEGSLTEPSANASSLVRQAQIQPHESVAIIGPGPIGLLALQHARLRSSRQLILIGRAVDGFRLELGRALGAACTISGETQSAAHDLLEITGGRGVDVVLQCAGSLRATKLALDITANGGRTLVEGFAGSKDTIPVSPDRLVVRSQTLRGVRGWSLSDFRTALDLQGRGLIQVAPLVTNRYPLEGFAGALRSSVDYAGGAVKVAFELVAEPNGSTLAPLVTAGEA